MSELRRGLVALGDSITNGRGEPFLGVPAQSWAQWTAEALELPFTKLARDGARAEEVLRDLAPRLRGPYDVACVYVGVNDARSLDWDAAAFERALSELLGAAARAADRVLVCTLPADLGRPSCTPKAAQASAIVRRVAAGHADDGGGGASTPDDRALSVAERQSEHGHPPGAPAPGVGRGRLAARPALVVSLDDLGGRRRVLPDAVHPTAIGQVEIAARAVRALTADGLPLHTDPWTLADRHRSRRAALAADRRWLALLAKDLRRRAFERVRPPS